jgi:hypothetical protein
MAIKRHDLTNFAKRVSDCQQTDVIYFQSDTQRAVVLVGKEGDGGTARVVLVPLGRVVIDARDRVQRRHRPFCQILPRCPRVRTA